MSNRVSFIFTGSGNLAKVAERIGFKVGKLTRKFGKFNRKLKDTDKQIKRTSGTFSKGFKRMAGAAIAFFGIRALFTFATEFQDSMADLSAITGASGDDLVDLRGKILDLSKAAATSGKETATAFKLVASAKPELLKNLDALAATTEQVLLLKNASGIELSTAADITAQSLNIFGKGAEFAAKFVNILAAGAKLGSSEVGDTGEAMLIAGPAARAAGLDFLQLNAALQTVAIGGIKGSRAGTALNTILGRLRRQSFDFEKQGLEGVFADIGAQLEATTDSTARAKLEAKFFGEEHSKVGLALVTNSKHLTIFQDVLKDTNIAQEQASIRLSTLSARMRVLGAVLGAKLLNVFTKLEPTLTNLADRLITFFDNMNDDSIDTLAGQLNGLLVVLEVVFDVLMGISAIFKGVGTGIGEFIGQVTTGTTSDDVATSFTDAFSIGGKFLGLFGGDEKKAPEKGTKAQSNVDISLRAPVGVIESIKQTTTGQTPGLNVGISMAGA